MSKQQRAAADKNSQQQQQQQQQVPKHKQFKLILVDISDKVIAAFKEHFKAFKMGEQVEIEHKRFEQLDNYDCLVSAANSFGLMDGTCQNLNLKFFCNFSLFENWPPGGIDAAITEYFGDQLQSRVQKHILQYYDGEQPVGTSFIIKTCVDNLPYLAHT